MGTTNRIYVGCDIWKNAIAAFIDDSLDSTMAADGGKETEVT
jgi:hypothetical protein